MREFCILGPLEVREAGRSLPLGGRRQRMVLALLLLSPNAPVPVERLIDGVWGTASPDTAVKTVRAYVSRLRALLGPALTASPGGYVLAVAPGALDADRFAELSDAGRRALADGDPAAAVEHLSRALAVWRGPALAGLEVSDVLTVEAARLEERRLAVVEQHMDAALAAGGHAEIVAELESLVARHPLREQFWAQLMLALYRCGRQAEALAAFHRAAGVLDRDLGVSPGPQLQQLQRQILRHDVAEVSRQHGNIPSAATSFVGRSAELATVENLLADSRLVTLVGVGGAGKTRLACEVAAAHFQRAWFVDLSGVRDPTLVVRAALDAFGGNESPRGSVIEAVVARARAGVDLLVLDNCEHLLDASAELAQTLLARCPDVRVLATSREPLDLPGETTFVVPPLGLPDPGTSDRRAEALTGFDSVRLFAERARAARPTLRLDANEMLVVAAICRRLDGLPLAIELAAARVRALSVSDLNTLLSERPDILTGGRGRPARHHTLRATIDWSYDLLGEHERELLCSLAVFSGGFTVPAAAAVSEDPDVLAPLERLIAASLVMTDDTASGRYRLLETVREYAADRLGEAGQSQDARRRHADYFLGLAREAAPHLAGPQESMWLARLAADHANLRSALAWFQQNAPREAVELTRSLAYFWRLRGHVGEAQRWLEYALDIEVETTPARAELMVHLGAVLVRRSEFAAAAEYLTDAVDLARALSEMRTLGLALHISGNAAGMQARYDDARVVLHEAVAVRRAAGDLVGLGMSLGALADMAMEEGQFEEGAALYQEGLALLRRAGTAAGVTAHLHSMAELAYVQGQDDRAETLAEEALTLADSIDDQWHQALVRIILAGVAEHRGDVAAVAGFVEAAVERLWALQEMRGLADAIEILAAAVADAGRPWDAAVLLAGTTEARGNFGVPIAPVHQISRDALERRLREELGDRFESGWTRGSLLSGEQLAAEAIAACRSVADGARTSEVSPV